MGGQSRPMIQFWKGTIPGPFHQSLVQICQVVSEEKMWTVNGRRTTHHGKSSFCLWQSELKITSSWSCGLTWKYIYFKFKTDFPVTVMTLTLSGEIHSSNKSLYMYLHLIFTVLFLWIRLALCLLCHWLWFRRCRVTY